MPLLGQGGGELDPDPGAFGLSPLPWDLLVSLWLGPDPKQQAGFLAPPRSCIITMGFIWAVALAGEAPVLPPSSTSLREQ